MMNAEEAKEKGKMKETHFLSFLYFLS